MNEVADKYNKNNELPQSESIHKTEKACTYGNLNSVVGETAA